MPCTRAGLSGVCRRFEEVEDEKPESKKRPRESDAMEVDGGKLSKAQKKKKQKGEDGKAVEVTTEKPAGKEKKEKGKEGKECCTSL